jgi:hypothetical protein
MSHSRGSDPGGLPFRVDPYRLRFVGALVSLHPIQAYFIGMSLIYIARITSDCRHVDLTTSEIIAIRPGQPDLI